MTKVFLLTIDALRYDIIEGDEVPTPNIDHLLANSVSFERAFSNGCGTPQAFPAILYSSSQNDGKQAPQQKSIASFFRENGFETIGITSNPYTSSYYGYDTGFDVFIDYVQPTPEREETSALFRFGRKVVSKFSSLYDFLTAWRAKHNLPYERAETINNEIQNHLNPRENQFFWAHYMDPHAPYSPPKEYGNRHCQEAFEHRGQLTNELYSDEVSEESQEMLWELYKTEVRYLDDKIGELLDEIMEIEDDVYIVFTSDHGEEFGERGKFQHKQFFEFNIHVPLGIHLPQEGGQKEHQIASHLDILPTLLSELNVPFESADGINLFSDSREHLVIDPPNKTIVLTDKWKLIDNSQSYLFDISDNLREDENVYDEKQDVAQELRTLAMPVSNIDF